MATRPPTFRSRPSASPQDADRQRGSARQRGYDPAWDKASIAYRRANPLCEYCAVGAFGPVRVSACAVVDHLYPHRRYPLTMWLSAWWVAACTECHSGPKQSIEHQGLHALHRLARRLGRPPWQGGG